MTRYWFIAAHHGRNKLAIVTFSLAFLVILLGAYTRLTNAGLSCPDWPHCYGYMTAPHTLTQLEVAASRFPTTPVDIKKAWTEMTHRYFAGTEGILIFILSFVLLRHRQHSDRKSLIIGFGLIGLVLVQVLLGMLTVTAKLKPVIVLSHLLTGLSILSMLWWACLTPTQTINANIKPWAWLGFLIVILQITLGGWVSTHYAGLACIDFPYCNGQLLPALQWQSLDSDLTTIHMLHRIGAMVTGIYLALLALVGLREPTFRSYALLILALVTLQITLGILNIIWLRPVWLALCHHAVGILLLLALLTTVAKTKSNTHA